MTYPIEDARDLFQEAMSNEDSVVREECLYGIACARRRAETTCEALAIDAIYQELLAA